MIMVCRCKIASLPNKTTFKNCLCVEIDDVQCYARIYCPKIRAAAFDLPTSAVTSAATACAIFGPRLCWPSGRCRRGNSTGAAYPALSSMTTFNCQNRPNARSEQLLECFRTDSDVIVFPVIYSENGYHLFLYSPRVECALSRSRVFALRDGLTATFRRSILHWKSYVLFPILRVCAGDSECWCLGSGFWLKL